MEVGEIPKIIVMLNLKFLTLVLVHTAVFKVEHVRQYLSNYSKIKMGAQRVFIFILVIYRTIKNYSVNGLRIIFSLTAFLFST